MNELSDNEIPQSLHNLAIFENGLTLTLTEVTEIDTIPITKRTTTIIFKDKGNYFYQVHLILNGTQDESSPLKKINKKEYDSIAKNMLNKIAEQMI